MSELSREPLVPDTSSDDGDEGWGSEAGGSGGRDDEFYERERPPHHAD